MSACQSGSVSPPPLRWPSGKACASRAVDGGRNSTVGSVLGSLSCLIHRLVGLVVKVPASRAEGPGFESRLRLDFSGSSHTSDLKKWHSDGYPARRLAL